VENREAVIEPLLLALDTATDALSCVVARGGQVVGEAVSHDARPHARLVAVCMQQALEAAGISAKELQVVVVGAGPGSYTGLRIGVAAAKGFCHALGIPLIGASSLRGLAELARALPDAPPFGSIVPMIDARRMEVYCWAFSPSGETLWRERAHILTQDAFAGLLGPVWAVGRAAHKLRQLGDIPGLNITSNLDSHARGLLPEALEAWAAQRYADLASFDPTYLKDVNIGRSGTFEPGAADPRSA
jgi:tRNA threonylcarbamoyladenosine biosynthesis protein TsaB